MGGAKGPIPSAREVHVVLADGPSLLVGQNPQLLSMHY